MKFIKTNAPFIRKQSSVERMMIDVLVALAPLTIFTSIIHGWYGIYVILISLLVTISCEIVFSLIMKKKDKIFDLHLDNVLAAAVTGLIYALLLPSRTEPYVVIVGALVASVIGKLIFGGTGSNVFNPAAVGRIFIGVCFPLAQEKYYQNSSFYDLVAGATPITSIKNNLLNYNSYSLSDLFFGFAPGSLGEVSKLLILIGGIYLVCRKSADFRPMLSAVISFVLLMLTAGIVEKIEIGSEFNIWKFVMYELFSGGFLFGCVFMISDPVTSPITKPGRVLYGMLVAIITVFIRLFGAYSEGFAFAILISNLLVPVIDYYKWSNSKFTAKNIAVIVGTLLLSILIIGIAL